MDQVCRFQCRYKQTEMLLSNDIIFKHIFWKKNKYRLETNASCVNKKIKNSWVFTW